MSDDMDSQLTNWTYQHLVFVAQWAIEQLNYGSTHHYLAVQFGLIRVLQSDWDDEKSLTILEMCGATSVGCLDISIAKIRRIIDATPALNGLFGISPPRPMEKVYNSIMAASYTNPGTSSNKQTTGLVDTIGATFSLNMFLSLWSTHPEDFKSRLSKQTLNRVLKGLLDRLNLTSSQSIVELQNAMEEKLNSSRARINEFMVLKNTESLFCETPSAGPMPIPMNQPTTTAPIPQRTFYPSFQSSWGAFDKHPFPTGRSVHPLAESISAPPRSSKPPVGTNLPFPPPVGTNLPFPPQVGTDETLVQSQNRHQSGWDESSLTDETPVAKQPVLFDDNNPIVWINEHLGPVGRNTAYLFVPHANGFECTVTCKMRLADGADQTLIARASACSKQNAKWSAAQLLRHQYQQFMSGKP